jgi:hypothetical protein
LFIRQPFGEQGIPILKISKLAGTGSTKDAIDHEE